MSLTNEPICKVLLDDAKELFERHGGAKVYCQGALTDPKAQRCVVGHLARAAFVRGLIKELPSTTEDAKDALAPYFGREVLFEAIERNDRSGTNRALIFLRQMTVAD